MNSATISVARPELEAFRPRDSNRSNGLLLDFLSTATGGLRKLFRFLNTV
jgi:hypothetical protein